MAYRSLTTEEIGLLLRQGCYAADWADISVKDEFIPQNIRNTSFGGKVKMGSFSGMLEDENGSSIKCGIYNSNIRNCEIADNSYISDVKNLTNYFVAENVAIENVGSLMMSDQSSFGNGTEIDILNEGGGRGLPIFDRLSSQIAYLTVLYRHDKDFTGKLLVMIRDYSESKRSGQGRIEAGSRIRNTLIIRNVFVGPYASVSGATLLEEGTIASCMDAPTYVGEGVTARKFIILSGSSVDGGALIEKTFVGQSVKMGKQYSAENSAFFANCEAFHGEGCSIFAGPYTVTHHKSTLLIASLYSFFNAGSGTNQSNHMYKLGPVHQGILERGSKTGSFAYLLLPCVVGAFSVVMGKHYANFDSSDFPFSYITEEKGKSELTPAMNIFTVGTRRDSEKWSARDKRKDPEKLDLINFELFNPYIVSKILNGINILSEFAEKTPKTQDWVNYKGISIHRLLLKASRKYYEMALKIYIGQELIKRIEGVGSLSPLSEIHENLMVHGKDGTGRWVDISGLFSPACKIEALIDSVKSGKIGSITELHEALRDIFNNYNKYAWEWCAELIGRQTGSEPGNISVSTILRIITDWKINAVKFNNMILKDAEKEFDAGAKLGFGIDGDETTREMDFEVVRGVYNENKFISGLQKESAGIEEKADRLIALLEKIQ
jgi:NDP-sugar pyrophosphorylase family protein